MTVSEIIHTKKVRDPARARRAKSLRNLAGFSRREFTKVSGIPPSTQQNWESEDGNGLTESGARRLVEIYKDLGIHFSLEWLLHGIGSPPIIENKLYGGPVSHPALEPTSYSEWIEKVLALFRQSVPESTDFIVEDDSMEPQLHVGDLVAGKRYYGKDIEQAVDQVCILLTMDGKRLLRYLKKGSVPKQYTLLATNLETSISNLVYQDIELVSAAPVLLICKGKQR